MIRARRTVGPIEAFLSGDHRRLEHLLLLADGEDGLDRETFERFREGLLRHLAMEENVLLPCARAKREGKPLPMAGELREDHAEIVKLLAPSPTPATVAALRACLHGHDALEEGPDGLYAQCDALLGDEAARVVTRLKAMPRVPTGRQEITRPRPDTHHGQGHGR